MAAPKEHKFTAYGWFTCLWILLVPFQFGWHISALNQLQVVLSCDGGRLPSRMGGRLLPDCIPMSDAVFSSLTSVLCLGGLIGSLASDRAMSRWGRRGASRASAVLIGAGAATMGLAPWLPVLVLGRFIVGLGAGGLSIAPLYLAEIAPPQSKGMIGSLAQLAVVLGIMGSQLAGLWLAAPGTWRLVLGASAGLATAQALLAPAVPESPVWLAAQPGGRVPAEEVTQRLWTGLPARDDDLESPLLARAEEAQEQGVHAVTILELIRARDLRTPLAGVCLLFIAQQISGINAVLYYSNAILARSFPTLGKYVSLAITLVNAGMTVPAIFLVDRIGRKKLLYGSGAGAVTALVLCGVGLGTGSPTLSTVAILAFVMSFAVGMGPVPFVLIPELSPPHAVAALASLGLSVHWVTNYAVGQTFLPLRNWLAGGEPAHEGRVFFVFAGALALTLGAFSRMYR